MAECVVAGCEERAGWLGFTTTGFDVPLCTVHYVRAGSDRPIPPSLIDVLGRPDDSRKWGTGG